MSVLLSLTTALMQELLAETLALFVSPLPRDKLILLLGVLGALSFGLTLCAFAVAETANAGFNILFSSFMNVAAIVGTYHVLRTSKTPIAIGFLIGVWSALAALNLMNCVYWAQLSRCTVEDADTDLAQYTCTSPYTYAAVSALSALMAATQTVTAALTAAWRGLLIAPSGGGGEDGHDEEGLGAGGHLGLDHNPHPPRFVFGAGARGAYAPVAVPPSADL